LPGLQPADAREQIGGLLEDLVSYQNFTRAYLPSGEYVSSIS
jgi:hypothetical protein